MPEPESAGGFDALVSERAEEYKLDRDALADAVHEELTRLVAREIAERVHAGDVKLPEPPEPPKRLGIAIWGRSGPKS